MQRRDVAGLQADADGARFGGRRGRGETLAGTRIMDIISIGAQAGGPKDGGIGRIKVDLYKALRSTCASTHCAAIDQYAVVIRVDGDLHTFGEEGIARLRFAKKRRYITADIQIPKGVWADKTKNEIRDYIAERVRETIVMFTLCLKKEGIETDDQALLCEVDEGIQKFKSTDYEACG